MATAHLSRFVSPVRSFHRQHSRQPTSFPRLRSLTARLKAHLPNSQLDYSMPEQIPVLFATRLGIGLWRVGSALFMAAIINPDRQPLPSTET